MSKTRRNERNYENKSTVRKILSIVRYNCTSIIEPVSNVNNVCSFVRAFGDLNLEKVSYEPPRSEPRFELSSAGGQVLKSKSC